ncbi:MAG TPA: hypothetical protein VMA36_13060 [Candidatus Limnocylindria bacterium]|jgi:hypothetical protein|nr:hypothetical protein [Candidatus Limnocylindria bacterium]
MKRFFLALTLALPAAALVTPALAVPAFAQSTANLAPADRYFGRMKMSILGIRNALKDLSAQIDAHPDDTDRVFDKAVLVEDALHDWQVHFPFDPWIPRFTYTLAQLYGKLDSDDARTHRHDMLNWLGATYPESEFAQLSRE